MLLSTTSCSARPSWAEAQALPDVLERELVVGHAWVYAELALGGMPQAAAQLYRRLSWVPVVETGRLLEFIERERPKGVGLSDVGLLSAVLRDGLHLWTLDAGLLAAASERHVAWVPRG